MKIILRRFFFLASILLLAQLHIFAQTVSTSNENLSDEKILEKAMPSVVLVLTGKGNGLLEKFGSGVIVRNDGVILTAYHVIKDATQVQIRLKNGEIYDKVDLLGFDERRDVAAVKISATELPAVTMRNEEIQAGGKSFVISNPQGLNWTVADGLLSSMRLADEIPNAGRGFRVVQFSAPVSSGSSGGLLLDEKGQAIGLIVATLTSGQNLNFAIPFSSVNGLADSTKKVMSFGSGSSLELPQPIRPPTAIDIVNTDPKEILRNAKIFYIYSDSVLISEKMMENALMKKPEFEKWNLAIVKELKLADVLINVEHQLFTFDYRFTMSDRKTSIVLASGKVTVWDGNIASGKFAKMIIAKLKELKNTKDKPDNKTEADKKTSEINR
jgi:hypothetical protein